MALSEHDHHNEQQGIFWKLLVFNTAIMLHIQKMHKIGLAYYIKSYIKYTFSFLPLTLD